MPCTSWCMLPQRDLHFYRYDPVRNVVERVPLALKGSGRFTLAAGKDGLYLAPFQAKNGLWKIPWEALESASWKEIEGVEISSGGRG